MALVGGLQAGTHLIDGHHHFQHGELVHDFGQLGRSERGGVLHQLGARDVDVDQTAGKLQGVDLHGLLGKVEVDAIAGDEGVDQVELGGLLAVKLDHDAVLDPDGRGRVIGRVDGDQTNLGPLGDVAVLVDWTRVQYFKTL